MHAAMTNCSGDEGVQYHALYYLFRIQKYLAARSNEAGAAPRVENLGEKDCRGVLVAVAAAMKNHPRAPYIQSFGIIALKSYKLDIYMYKHNLQAAANGVAAAVHNHPNDHQVLHSAERFWEVCLHTGPESLYRITDDEIVPWHVEVQNMCPTVVKAAFAVITTSKSAKCRFVMAR
jgi:hypothetical protein